MRSELRRVVRIALAVFATLSVTATAATARASSRAPAPAAAGVRIYVIAYRAHDGSQRPAYLALPAWYTQRHDPPLAIHA